MRQTTFIYNRQNDQDMKIAIIQDELVRKGGAEQVVLSFLKAFPDAPIYTLSYNPDSTYPEFAGSKINVSWFGRIIKSDSNLKRFFYPFGVFAMKAMRAKGYDVVLLSTTHCAKYVEVDANTLVITYCHTPFRLVFRPESYEQVSQANGIKAKLYKIVIKSLKRIDVRSACRTDYFITNAKEVVPRIEEAYHPTKPVTVINPPVKCSNFYLSESVGDYYLVVSRFEPYKKVDLIVKVFNKLKDKKLIVVGKGSMKKELLRTAGGNILFKEGLSSDQLADLYSKCKALIFPQHEDYGITPLEANASGRPVIAFGSGGVLDTMIPYSNDSSRFTAIFFKEQTEDSIIKAIHLFENLSFDQRFARKHAETFDESVFVEKIRGFVKNKYNLNKNES